jgi:hypothetical protein
MKKTILPLILTVFITLSAKGQHDHKIKDTIPAKKDTVQPHAEHVNMYMMNQHRMIIVIMNMGIRQ